MSSSPTHSSHSTTARSGRADGPLLGVLALGLALVAAGLAWLLSGERGDPAGGRSAGVPAERAEPEGAAAPDGPGGGDLPRPPGSGPGREVAAPDPAPLTGSSTTGRIRGTLEVDEGLELPTVWTVVTGPSFYLPDKDTAVELSVDVSGADFVVDDLPFGGYAVRAVAAGMNGLDVHVGVGPTNPEPYVTLRLSRAGFLDGEVLWEGGAPVEGLEVWLEDASSGARRTVRTDLTGTWRIDDVLDGEYLLTYGHPDDPLVPARKLQFRAPSLRVPRQELAPLAEIEVEVLDPFGFPVEGATVTAHGSAGGQVDETTDADGIARARFLPPGRWRIDTTHPEHPRASDTREIAAGERCEVLVRFRGE